MIQLSFPFEDQDCEAIIVGPYRYRLWRRWDRTLPSWLWIMLNPSTADGQTDDPTLRRVIRFSKNFEAGSCVVVNLFALRATTPNALKGDLDAVGPENDRSIQEAAERAEKIVVAWGNGGTLYGRDRAVLTLLAPWPVFCLGTTRAGHPLHPLYLDRTTQLRPYLSAQQPGA